MRGTFRVPVSRHPTPGPLVGPGAPGAGRHVKTGQGGAPERAGSAPERMVAHNRADVLEGGPRPGDPGPVFFHPLTGEPCPSYWPADLPERVKPRPLELPGSLWPDGGESPTFPVERALADLARVRWAPARPTIWLAPGAPEPSRWPKTRGEPRTGRLRSSSTCSQEPAVGAHKRSTGSPARRAGPSQARRRRPAQRGLETWRRRRARFMGLALRGLEGPRPRATTCASVERKGEHQSRPGSGGVLQPL